MTIRKNKYRLLHHWGFMRLLRLMLCLGLILEAVYLEAIALGIVALVLSIPVALGTGCHGRNCNYPPTTPDTDKE